MLQYICFIDGVELVRLTNDFIKYLLKGKKSVRLKNTMYKWERVWKILTEKVCEKFRQETNNSAWLNCPKYRRLLWSYILYKMLPSDRTCLQSHPSCSFSVFISRCTVQIVCNCDMELVLILDLCSFWDVSRDDRFSHHVNRESFFSAPYGRNQIKIIDVCIINL